MRIALAQINTIVGDLEGNARRIVDYAQRAVDLDADLIIFPELSVSGYPPLDLLDRADFIQAVERCLDDLRSRLPHGPGVIVGAPVPNPAPAGKRTFNAAILFENGVQIASVHKCLLPTYDIFDEYRYFEPARECAPVVWRGKRIGLHICEDMWNNEEQPEYHRYALNPTSQLGAAGVDLFVNISSSPFSLGKHGRRNRVIDSIVGAFGKPFVLVNHVAANTEIIFDGDSRVHRGDGKIVLNAPSFEEALLVWDEDDLAPCPERTRTDIDDLHDALVLGIRDYFRKTGAFDKVIISLSGGIDSAVTCALAVEALGSDRVVGVTMPSAYSSPGSVDDSLALARNLDIPCDIVSIAPAVDAIGGMLAGTLDGGPTGLTEENIQARVRGVALMALSNRFNYLVLSTGNKSEMSVGYMTLYGDMSGGLAVLADVLKTQVYELAQHINRREGREVVPQSIITKPPSAELRPGQLDTDSLPPYAVLDKILRLYIEERLGLAEVVARTALDSDLVKRILDMVDRSEYKRRQAPPGLRVSGKAFGIGRRLPIVMKWKRDDKTVEVSR